MVKKEVTVAMLRKRLRLYVEGIIFLVGFIAGLVIGVMM